MNIVNITQKGIFDETKKIDTFVTTDDPAQAEKNIRNAIAEYLKTPEMQHVKNMQNTFTWENALCIIPNTHWQKYNLLLTTRFYNSAFVVKYDECLAPIESDKVKTNKKLNYILDFINTEIEFYEEVIEPNDQQKQELQHAYSQIDALCNNAMCFGEIRTEDSIHCRDLFLTRFGDYINH